MNKIILLGRIGQDLELKNVSETQFLKINLAVNDGYGENKKTNWFNCTAFGKIAENISKYVTKGQQILVEGKLNAGMYEKDGQKIFTTDIIINNFYFINNQKNNISESDKIHHYNDKLIEDAELPF